MSLLPSTLLNATSNEDQTLEIHSEILEPLAHSQNITRWEIPHKNILDSDSVMIWNVHTNYPATTNGGVAYDDHVALPYLNAGLYECIKRARLFVNGKIISELNEVGKYLTLKNDFTPHEVKTEVNDFFSYANHEIKNNGGKIEHDGGKMLRTPNDKQIGPKVEAKGHAYKVEASIKLHQLFAILKDAQLDTNNIEGKIMIEIDWNSNNSVATKPTCIFAGANDVDADKVISVDNPRLILDFLTYNAEVQAQIRNTIWGDGAGVNMPFREVALVRKTLNIPTGVTSVDINMGMTGRAIQKIWVAKVMNCDGNDVNILNGDNRSDLLEGQKWNVRINDLMIYDRDVDNRAEEFNYLQQTGEKQYTCVPSAYEMRNATKANRNTYTASDDDFVADAYNVAFQNATPVSGNFPANCPNGDMEFLGEEANVRLDGSTAIAVANAKNQICGRQNYLGINLAKYKSGAESPLNAMRVGSTPIVFNLTYGQGNDANTTDKGGTIFFWVEYLKLMNLKNGQISVMDM